MNCNHEFIGMSTGVVCKRCQMKKNCAFFPAGMSVFCIDFLELQKIEAMMTPKGEYL